MELQTLTNPPTPYTDKLSALAAEMRRIDFEEMLDVRDFRRDEYNTFDRAGDLRDDNDD